MSSPTRDPNSNININNSSVSSIQGSVSETANQQSIPQPLRIRCLAQFIGTMIFAIGVNCSGLQPQNTPPIVNKFFVSMSLSFSILMTANISGGHLNPAVTLAVMVQQQNYGKRESQIELLGYWGSQFLGAFIGGWIVYYVQDFISSPYPDIETDHFLVRSIFCQLMGAFLFIQFILIMTNPQTSYVNINFFIVLTIGAGLMAAGNLYNLSGAVFNPAIGVGLQIFDAIATKDWSVAQYFYVYLIFPLIGGSLTALYYNKIYRPFMDVGQKNPSVKVEDQ